MKRFGIQLLLILILATSSCKSKNALSEKYQSENLQIEKITDHIYRHISYLDIPNYGKFACNGIIVLDANEALVFDTPVNDTASAELIDWIEKEQKSIIKGVVVNHFHNDCLGGLETFHKANISSYASFKTIELAQLDDATIPQFGFADSLRLNAGEVTTVSKYFGPAHTRDNIVSYVPSQNILFGGCMIKSLGAGKGNLEDAAPDLWPETVQKIQQHYKNIEVVIPGHGKPGDSSLLDYTVTLFTD